MLIALTDLQWTGFFTLAGAAVGGLTAGGIAWRTARENRNARLELARAGRQHATRVDVYAELSAMLQRMLDTIERTFPIIGPLPESPPRPSDQEWQQLMGRVTIAASQAVLDDFEGVAKSSHEFHGAAMVLRAYEEQGGTPQQRNEARVEVKAARARTRELASSLQRRMRDELLEL